MNLFNKLPGSERAPTGLDWALLRRLPLFPVAGTVVPLLCLWMVRLAAGPLKAVEGKSMNVTTSSMGVKVNGANVIKTDVIASNGVIHVIDNVVVPN